MQTYLYLARHAHAASHAPSDAERPLSPEGYAQIERLAKGLRASGAVRPETIWHSNLRRAIETAQALQEQLELSAPFRQMENLAPEDDPAGLLPAIDELSQNCLIVGHEPNLSQLASYLLAGKASFERIVFPKASILCLSRLKVGSQKTPWLVEWHLNHHLFA